ncbi:MAG: response regulator, partial [Chloroflexi bacterium]|nr:response regulator [Chloroflexota bacterium]
SPDHPGVQYCDDMLSAVRQMVEINYDLLALGRRGLIGSAPVDMNRLVRQVVTEIVDRPDTLSVQVETALALPPVDGSEAQLSRVLANLIANAREAMHDAGCLRVATDNVHVNHPFGGYNRVEAGQYVRFSVADTGCGIPPEIRTRIFDAFFTTKRTDRKRGSGLGLSVVQAIVEDHHGYLDLETDVGKGTTFAVYLPVSSVDSVRPQQKTKPMGGTERLLVADDDPAQLKVAGELLKHLGYAVQTASSGEQALEALATNPVDLLILDIVMPPGIDGTETYRRALSLRPGLPAVFLSGYAESKQIVEARKLGATAFVNKPVSLEKLAQAVRTQLDQR